MTLQSSGTDTDWMAFAWHKVLLSHGVVLLIFTANGGSSSGGGGNVEIKCRLLLAGCYLLQLIFCIPTRVLCRYTLEMPRTPKRAIFIFIFFNGSHIAIANSVADIVFAKQQTWIQFGLDNEPNIQIVLECPRFDSLIIIVSVAIDITVVGCSSQQSAIIIENNDSLMD